MTTFEQQYLSRFSELSAFSRTEPAGCLAESHVECMLIHPFRGESEHCGNSQSRPFWVGIPGEWLKQVLAICNESVLVNLQGKKTRFKSEAQTGPGSNAMQRKRT